jgi:ribosomal protein S18 acetylase RimI-like enzyme
MTEMNSPYEYRIEPFDSARPAPAATLARLHEALLPRSPVQKLGRAFLEKFYYVHPVCDGAFFGAVAYIGAQPAGFIVATDDSAHFMQSVLRRHSLRLAATLALSILRSPRRLAAAVEGLRIMTSRGPVDRNSGEGEILSLGVLPEFTGPKFVRESGLYVARDLLNNALEQLRARDVKLIRAIVDSDNTPAMLFYSAQGWELASADVPGWTHPSSEFVTSPPLSPSIPPTTSSRQSADTPSNTAISTSETPPANTSSPNPSASNA